jgi:hypothetical protein
MQHTARHSCTTNLIALLLLLLELVLLLLAASSGKDSSMRSLNCRQGSGVLSKIILFAASRYYLCHSQRQLPCKYRTALLRATYMHSANPSVEHTQ